MKPCPTCEKLAREVEILRRIDYRACAEKATELLQHKLDVHKPEIKNDNNTAPMA